MKDATFHRQSLPDKSIPPSLNGNDIRRQKHVRRKTVAGTASQHVWVGHFRLRIRMSEVEPIVRESLLFAACWSEAEALSALHSSDMFEQRSCAVETTEKESSVIQVPASGRSGIWGLLSTCNYPRFLVIEYLVQQTSNPTPARKIIPVPAGRGDRSIHVKLP